MKRYTRTQQIVAGIIYFFFGLILVTLFFGGLLTFFNAPRSSAVWGIFYSAYDFFLKPFIGIYPDTKFLSFTLSLAGLVAATVYPLISYNIVNLVTSFLVLNPFKIFMNLVLFLLRFIESVLFIRFLFKALVASTKSTFVGSLYDISDFIPNTLSILPTIRLGSTEIETATFLVLGIIITLDFLAHNLFEALFGEDSYRNRYR